MDLLEQGSFHRFGKAGLLAHALQYRDRMRDAGDSSRSLPEATARDVRHALDCVQLDALKRTHL